MFLKNKVYKEIHQVIPVVIDVVINFLYFFFVFQVLDEEYLTLDTYHLILVRQPTVNRHNDKKVNIEIMLDETVIGIEIVITKFQNIHVLTVTTKHAYLTYTLNVLNTVVNNDIFLDAPLILILKIT